MRSLVWRYRPVVPGGAWGAMAPQILADQLTLSQPRGKIILAPPDFFRPSDGPEIEAY